MTMHLEPAWLARYARGELDQARSFSVEAHLPGCFDCRAQVAALVDRDRLDAVWDAIDLAIDAPHRTPVERAMARLGVPEGTARLLAATPSLRLSWLVAVALALVFASVASQTEGDRGVMLFLLLAPLLPLAGVAAGFGPNVDPAHELTVSAPFRSLRLLLLRALAVLATTLPLTLVASLALPGLDWTAAAWLLPAAGLTLAGLASATVVPGVAGCAAIAGVWAFVVVGVWRSSGDPLAAFGQAGQLACLAVAVAGVLTLAARREHLEAR